MVRTLAPPIPALRWQPVPQVGLPGGARFWRAPVPGGVLYLFEGAGGVPALSFVPTFPEVSHAR